MRTNIFQYIVTFILTFLAPLGPVSAQSDDGNKPEDKSKKPAAAKDEAKPKKSETAKEEPKGPITALVGATIHPVTQSVIRNGTVLIQDGKILNVGKNVEIPKGAKVIDAKGKHITPGFVAMNMSGVGLSTQRSSRGGSSNRRSSSGSVTDTLDPFDRDLKYCLGVGITTGCAEIRGGSSRFRRRNEEDELSVCPCCNLPFLPAEPIRRTTPSTPRLEKQVILKLTYGKLKPMLVKEMPFYAMSVSGLTGPVNRYTWRQNLKKAKDYLKQMQEHEQASKEGNAKRPPRRPVAEALVRLAKKEIPLRIAVSSKSQIRDMIQLAKELDYRLVLENVHEAWLIPEELSKANVTVVITPRSQRRPQRGNEDTTGSSIETSRYLEKSAVPFALGTLSSSVSLNGLAGRDLTSLPLEAAFAVRGGCREETALAALTIVPARAMGMGDRIGSIEKGKDADLLVLDGPPLDYRTYVDQAIIAGEVYYDRAKDRVYPVFARDQD